MLDFTPEVAIQSLMVKVLQPMNLLRPERLLQSLLPHNPLLLLPKNLKRLTVKARPVGQMRLPAATRVLCHRSAKTLRRRFFSQRNIGTLPKLNQQEQLVLALVGHLGRLDPDQLGSLLQKWRMAQTPASIQALWQRLQPVAKSLQKRGLLIAHRGSFQLPNQPPPWRPAVQTRSGSSVPPANANAGNPKTSGQPPATARGRHRQTPARGIDDATQGWIPRPLEEDDLAQLVVLPNPELLAVLRGGNRFDQDLAALLTANPSGLGRKQFWQSLLPKPSPPKVNRTQPTLRSLLRTARQTDFAAWARDHGWPLQIGSYNLTGQGATHPRWGKLDPVQALRHLTGVDHLKAVAILAKGEPPPGLLAKQTFTPPLARTWGPVARGLASQGIPATGLKPLFAQGWLGRVGPDPAFLSYHPSTGQCHGALTWSPKTGWQRHGDPGCFVVPRYGANTLHVAVDPLAALKARAQANGRHGHHFGLIPGTSPDESASQIGRVLARFPADQVTLDLPPGHPALPALRQAIQKVGATCSPVALPPQATLTQRLDAAGLPSPKREKAWLRRARRLLHLAQQTNADVIIPAIEDWRSTLAVRLAQARNRLKTHPEQDPFGSIVSLLNGHHLTATDLAFLTHLGRFGVADQAAWDRGAAHAFDLALARSDPPRLTPTYLTYVASRERGLGRLIHHGLVAPDQIAVATRKGSFNKRVYTLTPKGAAVLIDQGEPPFLVGSFRKKPGELPHELLVGKTYQRAVREALLEGRRVVSVQCEAALQRRLASRREHLRRKILAASGFSHEDQAALQRLRRQDHLSPVQRSHLAVLESRFPLRYGPREERHFQQWSAQVRAGRSLDPDQQRQLQQWQEARRRVEAHAPGALAAYAQVSTTVIPDLEITFEEPDGRLRTFRYEVDAGNGRGGSGGYSQAEVLAKIAGGGGQWVWATPGGITTAQGRKIQRLLTQSGGMGRVMAL